MKQESRISYSDLQPQRSVSEVQFVDKREALKNAECYKSKPRILAFIGASGSGKDLALEILTSLPGRRSVSRKLELSYPVSIRMVPKITDRPPRMTEVSKIPISPEEFTQLKESGQLIGEYTLQSNGSRYAYRKEDILQTCKEDFLVAEPSVLHILDLKEKFGDQIYCTFLTSSRGYRERLLRKRGTESGEEIIRRLDEGDGQTFVALLLAGKPIDFISQFVSPEIASDFQALINADPQTWDNQAALPRLRERVGPEVMDILENVIAHKGKVVDELINIDRFSTFIDDIVILEDKFITDNPYQAGLFSESVIDTATRMLLNSENRVYSVDQTADTHVICNLVVPEATKSIDTIFGVPYKKLLDAIKVNQEDRVLQIQVEGQNDPVEVHWISYYEDRERMLGLTIRDPQHPEAVVSFMAVKPDESQEALIEFQIHLAPIHRATDRYVTQMAFMSQALKMCEALGINKFHYAEHFDLVDENDTVIGIIPRSVAHEEGKFIHRASSVLVWRSHFDEAKKENVKQLLMVHRSKNKKMNANVWQAAPSGHVLPGETYAEAARRELREEIGTEFAQGISKIQPLMPVRVYSEYAKVPNPQKENFYFFMAHVDKETADLVTTNYESDKAVWMDVDTIRDMMSDDPSQFRDAFRMVFETIDWDKLSTSDPQSALVGKKS